MSFNVSLKIVYPQTAMGLTLAELKATLGLETIPQVRHRIELLREILKPFIRRGENNEIIIEPSGTEILRRLEDLRKTGLTLEQAAKRIKDENNLEKRDGRPQEALDETEVNYLKLLLQEKDKQIQILLEEVQWLRSLLQNRLPPSQEEAKAKRWWRFWVRR